MRLPFATSAFERIDGLLPSVRLRNLYAEKAPTAPGGTILLPRMGMERQYETAPVRGVYRADGVLNGAVLVVAGDTLLADEAEVGTVADDGQRVEWAFTVDGLFILSGGIVYQYDGDTLEATDFPDDASVASITSLNQVLVAVRRDTGTVYFRLAGDTSWNALDFFSAEREPDPAVCVRALSDILYVFGTSSVEPFAPTGDAETPFSRIEGLSITRGCKDRDSVVRLDNTLFFTAENNIAFRIEGAPVRISDHGIEGRIQESNSASAWAYNDAGHDFYVLNLDAETLVYDVATGQWHEVTWPARVGWDDGMRVWVGADDGLHLLVDRPDDNGAPIERLFTALAQTQNPGSADVIQVGISVGTADANAEPGLLSMRWSDDEGRRWTDWKEAQTGFWGEFRRRVRYRRGGMIDAPGRAYEFRFTDPIRVAFTGVDLNPPSGGRARV